MPVATKRKATAEQKVSTEPDPTQDGGGEVLADAPEQPIPDVSVDLDPAPEAADTPAPGAGAPAAPTGGGAPTAGGGAPAAGGGTNPGVLIGTPMAAPAGSSGFYMGIKLGVPSAAAHAAAMGDRAGTFSDPGYLMGTIAPRAGWPA